MFVVAVWCHYNVICVCIWNVYHYHHEQYDNIYNIDNVNTFKVCMWLWFSYSRDYSCNLLLQICVYVCVCQGERRKTMMMMMMMMMMGVLNALASVKALRHVYTLMRERTAAHRSQETLINEWGEGDTHTHTHTYTQNTLKLWLRSCGGDDDDDEISWNQNERPGLKPVWFIQQYKWLMRKYITPEKLNRCNSVIPDVCIECEKEKKNKNSIHAFKIFHRFIYP